MSTGGNGCRAVGGCLCLQCLYYSRTIIWMRIVVNAVRLIVISLKVLRFLVRVLLF